MSRDQIIVIAGPTASGKSALAVDLAEKLNGVVINADSMQVYQNMPVITACPDALSLKRAPHRLFEIYPPSFGSSVADWLKLATIEIKEALEHHLIPIVVGGTGFYIDALINGVSPVPAVEDKIKSKVQQLLDQIGVLALHEKLRSVDPLTAERLKPADTSRVRRAYEVFEATRIPLSKWHELPLKKSFENADFFVVKLFPDMDVLTERINRRLDIMLSQGALKEVEELVHQNLNPLLPAMKALGVPEFARLIKKQISQDQALQEAKLHTRQFAKRQRTWFSGKLQADITLENCYQPQMLVSVIKAFERWQQLHP